MLNRPFSSTNTSIINEQTTNTTPAIINGQNVLIAQDQQQKVFNTLTTSIAGVPQYSPYMPNPSNYVTFTFGQQPLTQNFCPNPNFQNLNQMQQATAWELLQLQKQLNEPFQCKFHVDNQTSTSDLRNRNRKLVLDLQTLAGRFKPEMYTNPKKLTIKHVTAKVEGHVYDELEAKKQVCFDTNRRDEMVQAELCNCDCKIKIRQHRRRRKSKTPSTTPTPTTSDCSSDEDRRR